MHLRRIFSEGRGRRFLISVANCFNSGDQLSAEFTILDDYYETQNALSADPLGEQADTLRKEVVQLNRCLSQCSPFVRFGI